MLNKLKYIVKKIMYGPLCDSQTYVCYLRKKGIKIGKNVEFFSLRHIHIDDLNPHLLEIGNNVNIVGSEILTHDYSWSVIKGMTGEILGNQKKVIIGDNVFIGHGSVILCGTVIGNNVIIGANSVVSGIIESGFVYAGTPAKKIMSIEDYYTKRKQSQYDEALDIFIRYKKTFKMNPPEELFHEYFYLFTNSSKNLNRVFEDKLKLCGNFEMSQKYLDEHSAMFLSYENFVNNILNKNNGGKL